jgi:hypothetical protein
MQSWIWSNKLLLTVATKSNLKFQSFLINNCELNCQIHSLLKPKAFSFGIRCFKRARICGESAFLVLLLAVWTESVFGLMDHWCPSIYERDPGFHPSMMFFWCGGSRKFANICCLLLQSNFILCCLRSLQ